MPPTLFVKRILFNPGTKVGTISVFPKNFWVPLLPQLGKGPAIGRIPPRIWNDNSKATQLLRSFSFAVFFRMNIFKKFWDILFFFRVCVESALRWCMGFLWQLCLFSAQRKKRNQKTPKFNPCRSILIEGARKKISNFIWIARSHRYYDGPSGPSCTPMQLWCVLKKKTIILQMPHTIPHFGQGRKMPDQKASKNKHRVTLWVLREIETFRSVINEKSKTEKFWICIAKLSKKASRSFFIIEVFGVELHFSKLHYRFPGKNSWLEKIFWVK